MTPVRKWIMTIIKRGNHYGSTSTLTGNQLETTMVVEPNPKPSQVLLPQVMKAVASTGGSAFPWVDQNFKVRSKATDPM